MSDTKLADEDSLLKEKEAATFLAVSVRTLQAWRIDNSGPPFIRLGRAIRYRLKALIEWLNSNTRQSKT